MTIPGSVGQLLVVLIFVVPGFVYQGVRIRLVGRTPADLELPTRVLRAIVASTIFGLFYVLALGDSVTNLLVGSSRVEHPRTDSILAMTGAFGVPALVAWIVSLDRQPDVHLHPRQSAGRTVPQPVPGAGVRSRSRWRHRGRDHQLRRCGA